ncbi:MAG: hypothetical protein ABIG28_00650 [archaeon]
MDIIKEQTEKTCVIRSEAYTKSLGHLLELFSVAKADFPSIEPPDVDVLYYAGGHYAKTYGLEFRKPEGSTVPDGYKLIRDLEDIF